MKSNVSSIVILSLGITLLSQSGFGQAATESKQPLTEKQKAIVLISTLTTKGDLAKLKQALNAGLDAKLTINEAKEVLVHLYAYCGFPRSIQGLNTLITVINERKAKGFKDNPGREASPVNDSNKYETGWKNFAKLGGVQQTAR